MLANTVSPGLPPNHSHRVLVNLDGTLPSVCAASHQDGLVAESRGAPEAQGDRPSDAHHPSLESVVFIFDRSGLKMMANISSGAQENDVSRILPER